MTRPLRLILATLLLALSCSTGAATFTANSTLDLPDANPGNGICDPVILGPGNCTLRAAIMEINALGPGPHRVQLLANLTYTLTRSGIDDTGLNGDLDILNNMQVVCVGCDPIGSNRPVVTSTVTDRLFDIIDGTVTLQNIVLRGGVAFDDGGAVLIRNTGGTVRLLDLLIEDNAAIRGGAIANRNPGAFIERTEIRNNGSNSINGTAIYSTGGLIIRDSAIYGNFTNGNGIAIMAETSGPGQARITLENSTLSGHQGTGLLAQAAAEVRIRNSTITRHTLTGVTVIAGQTATVTWSNNVIARNGTDCGVGPGDIVATGFNLFGDNSCPVNPDFADISNSNPLLTPLQRRGPGQTPVHWPRKGSPALNTGSTLPGGVLSCEPFDQVGEPRPQGFAGPIGCDRGAAEVPEDAIFSGDDLIDSAGRPRGCT